MSKRIAALVAIALTGCAGGNPADQASPAGVQAPPVQTPLSFSGSGRIGLTDSFTLTAGRRYFRGTHDGNSYFVVYLTDLKGERERLIFRHNGTFEGTYNYFMPAGEFHFDVEADGNWTLAVE